MVPHVDWYPKACLLCPLICYTPDLLQCYSLCCMCFLQGADFPHLFGDFFLAICSFLCIHLPEGRSSWGGGGLEGGTGWAADRQGCWCSSPGMGTVSSLWLPHFPASMHLHCFNLGLCLCGLLLSTGGLRGAVCEDLIDSAAPNAAYHLVILIDI